MINLKIHPQHFGAISHPNPHRRKRVEIRKEDDVIFEVGDDLRLNEWNPFGKYYTGRFVVVEVTHILRGRPYLPKGYAALSIQLRERA